ncbi:MAG: T9SS type A sorting domain-containing protein [Bacteroidales bacterium]|nr:T9SS type A sorting domain-containing protein [Bacteroidales bacterium]
MSRRLLFSALLLSLICVQGMAQRIGYDWIKTFPNTGAAVSTIDNDNNILIAGSYSGTLTFGDKTVTSTENKRCIFLAKFDNLGNINWIISDTLQSVNDIAVDAEGNIFLTSTVKYMSMIGEHLHVVSFIYVAKFDESGNKKWISTSDFQALDRPDWNLSTSIACDSQGSTYITGYYINSISFGSQELENGSVYVAKFDSTGFPVWIKNISGYGGVGYDILVDRNDQLFITGYFSKSQANYIFLIRLNTDGDAQNQTQIIGSSPTRGERLHSDKDGNLYLAALFNGLVTVNGKNYNAVEGGNNPVVLKIVNDSIVSVTHLEVYVGQSLIDRDFCVDDNLNLFYIASISKDYKYTPMIFRIDSNGVTIQQLMIAQGYGPYFAILSSINHDTSGSLFLTGLTSQMAYFGDSLAGYPGDNRSAFLGKINFDELFNGIPYFEEGKGVILIYPSLTRESIYIESHSENLSNKEMKIYNSAGGMVQQVTLLSNKSEINISGLSQGIYFVEISGNGFRETHKIVKY